MGSDRHFTAQEAATLYGIAESTVRKYIRNDRLKATKHGKVWRIAESALVEAFPNRAPIPHDEPCPEPHAVPRAALSSPESHAEIEALQRKLESSEVGHDATRRELDTVREALQDARGDIAHLQSLSTSQSESIGALTTELQGLTAIVHHRRMLDMPPAEDPEEPAKPGVLARWFGGRRRRHVRIGHA
jgi:excisionase family DNA binding protein